MKLLWLYKLIAGSQNDFIKQFQNNEYQYNQAKAFWSTLDASLWIVVICMIVISIGLAVYYYTAYNNSPGRHYKPLKWLMFFGITFIVTLGVSYGLEYMLCAPKLDGANALEFRVAIGNSLYAIALYTIISVVWCNLLPTNAYRMFKF